MKYFKLILIAAVYFSLNWVILGYTANNILNINIEYYDLLLLIIIGSVIISVVKFIILEIEYRILQKDKLVTLFYQAFIIQGFPNPRNYHIDPNYLLNVANTDGIDPTVRVQSIRLRSEINLLSESGKIFQTNRLKYALIIAINKYFRHFKDEYQISPDIESTYSDPSKDAYEVSYLGALIMY